MVRLSHLIKVGPSKEPQPAPSAPSPQASPKPSEPSEGSPPPPPAAQVDQSKPTQELPVAPEPLQPPPAPEPSDRPAPQAEHEARAKEAEVLYDALVWGCQRCLGEVQQGQALSVGDLPALAERMAKHLFSGDEELVRLCLDGERTGSLAHHVVNVAILSVHVAAECGFRSDQLVETALAGLLHDIGMVTVHHLMSIPAHLTRDQIAQIRDHPIVGHRLLLACQKFPAIVAEVALQEHERRDGSGYPRRLAGEDIHQLAQLVGLLDCYEALTHDRPHRRRLLASEAMRLIIDEHRGRFPDDLFRSFLSTIPIYPIGSWVRLTTGQVARVARTNRYTPLSPTVEVVTDARGDPLEHPETFDLATERHLAIFCEVTEPLRGR